MLVRQIVSILALPCTVTVLVPWWIVRRVPIAFTTPGGVVDLLVVLAGAACGVVGLSLFAWSLYHFWTQGRGTLAPWDPPRRFVVSGPYRFVRNPMISGVIFILAAEACVLRSWALTEWTAFFTLINAVYIPAIEEPMLRARFGDAYDRYARAVRRFVPRLTPYRPEPAQA
jgi:protein-S-isoprenylcysteine O-methyltransferase Ste14